MTKRKESYKNSLISVSPAELDVKAKIEGYSIPVPESGCWIWVGSWFGQGYPLMCINEHVRRVNRVSYEAFVGPIPDGLMICHKCDTRLCVNPDHLYAGTARQNAQDRDKRGRANSPFGSKHGRSKLTTEQALAIREDPRGRGEVAREYGVSEGTVYAIKTGRKRSKELSQFARGPIMSKAQDLILGRLQDTPAEIVTRQELIQVIGSKGKDPDDTLSVLIFRLRQRLEKGTIKTHRHKGYSWQAQG